MADKKIDSDTLPHVVAKAKSELSSLPTGLVENALTQALPLPDIMFGGAVLLLVVMVHAFCIRLVTGSALKHMPAIRALNSLLRADLLFLSIVAALLALHLTEVVLWSAALILGEIVADWPHAAYFAANCYTALGEPFKLPDAWRIVPPIIAMSGIFTFAWTASVLVDFVSRYNDMRASILADQQQHLADRRKAPSRAHGRQSGREDVDR